ncbi:3-ketoacyl-ACP reductase [Deinococcus deserti]|uniref:Putative short-chain dehydrogenase n=1 Tax=Deinococcus deserti (strain DSM 17065 / CIP 109153 / LMG 22923 / VCD115) TaxID=546414 RepID=C1D0M0_DEIDV|nr:3-ketoacyl-ACP reductase [Deinococcus deserti]ACO45394.1 putative short-chain dehydrogenase [Deinococcus deserti VCD115]
MTDLTGKTAIVTGAGKGIGKAIALAFAQEGVHVGLIARDRKGLEALAEEISGQYKVKVGVAPVDVSDRAGVEAAVAQLAGELGSVDILVNNAGTAQFGSVLDMEPAEWERMIQVNLLGTYYATRAALPYMVRQGSGNIINIASTAGEKGAATASAYAASKAGVIAFTEALMPEVRKHNVRVILMNPSTVNTDLATSLGLKIGEEDRMLQAEDVAQVLVAALKLPQRALVRNLSLLTTNPQ